MAAHFACCRVAVASQDRLHDPVVLLMAELQPADTELGAAEGGHAPAHRQEGLGQEGIVAAGIEAVVKPVVGFGISGQIAGVDQVLGVADVDQLLPFGGRHGTCTAGGRERLQFGHHREHLAQPLLGQCGDDRPTMGAMHHQPGCGQFARASRTGVRDTPN